MTILHILKDGTELEDITGHVVRMEDAKDVYAIIDRINKKGRRHGNNGQQK